MIDNSFYNEIPNEIIYFGFPRTDYSDTFKSNIHIGIGNYEKSFENLHIPLEKANKLIFTEQKINQIVEIFRLNYFFSVPMANEGFSGSPVFGKFNHNGRYIYKFVGVLFGWIDEGKKIGALGIQSKSVMNYIRLLK